MPFKIEIHTMTRIYDTTAPEDCTDPIKWAEDKLANSNESFILDDGSIWKPWNRDHITGLLQVPNLPAVEDNPGEALEPEQEKPKPWQGATGVIHTWKERVTYLGSRYEIVVLSTWDVDSCAYFLLFTINGTAARDMISDRGQVQMIADWLKQNYQYAGEYKTVVPHGTICDLEEAEAYLKDYVKETAPEYKPKEKTGKAWQGWNEERGRG